MSNICMYEGLCYISIGTLVKQLIVHTMFALCLHTHPTSKDAEKKHTSEKVELAKPFIQKLVLNEINYKKFIQLKKGKGGKIISERATSYLYL